MKYGGSTDITVAESRNRGLIWIHVQQLLSRHENIGKEHSKTLLKNAET